MQHVWLDLFSFGWKSFLICVDHWSDYRLFHVLRSLSSESIIKGLTSWFNTLGWLSSIHSDGGPQFCGDFPKLCQKYHICHELSSPYNLKSNSLAEAGVKSVKNILSKSHASDADPDVMLYEWRNMPRSDGYSPAQLLFGRRQRTCLPLLPSFSALSISSEYLPLDMSEIPTSHARTLSTITEAEVTERIKKAKKANSVVPGNIPPVLYSHFPAELTVPITIIFNKITTDLD